MIEIEPICECFHACVKRDTVKTVNPNVLYTKINEQLKQKEHRERLELNSFFPLSRFLGHFPADSFRV